jgi:hypothetical protein
MQPSDILLDRQLDKMPIGIKEVNRFENAACDSEVMISRCGDAVVECAGATMTNIIE